VADYRRVDEAARAVGISRSTLEGWARAGLVGRSRIGRVVWIDLDDCRELIAAHATGRRIVPITAPSAPATPEATLEAARAYFAGPSAPAAQQQRKGRRRG
jgi:hypothetical protein